MAGPMLGVQVQIVGLYRPTFHSAEDKRFEGRRRRSSGRLPG